MPSDGSPNSRPLVGLIWLLIVAVLLIGVYKLFHLDHRSHDQQILVRDAGRH